MLKNYLKQPFTTPKNLVLLLLMILSSITIIYSCFYIYRNCVKNIKIINKNG